jgi:hypothetical protein
VTAVRPGRFLDFRRTELAALRAGKPIADYLEEIWNCEGQATRISGWMQEIGCYQACNTILEIGPGSGRFLGPTMDRAGPTRYEIYETARSWAEWLARSNSPHVIAQPANGRSLCATPSASCDLVHAHGVFVYLKLLTCFEYFGEMIRVASPRGHIIFDFFPCESFDERALSAWLASKDRFATLLPRKLVIDFFRRRGFYLLATCNRSVGAGQATYLAFRNSGRMYVHKESVD